MLESGPQKLARPVLPPLQLQRRPTGRDRADPSWKTLPMHATIPTDRGLKQMASAITPRDRTGTVGMRRATAGSPTRLPPLPMCHGNGGPSADGLEEEGAIAIMGMDTRTPTMLQTLNTRRASMGSSNTPNTSRVAAGLMADEGGMRLTMLPHTGSTPLYSSRNQPLNSLLTAHLTTTL